MESEKDDFNIIVGNKFEMDIFKVSLSLFERRLEAALLSQTQYGESHKILDSKGNLLNEIDPPQTFQGKKEGIELQKFSSFSEKNLENLFESEPKINKYHKRPVIFLGIKK